MRRPHTHLSSTWNLDEAVISFSVLWVCGGFHLWVYTYVGLKQMVTRWEKLELYLKGLSWAVKAAKPDFLNYLFYFYKHLLKAFVSFPLCVHSFFPARLSVNVLI